MGHGGNGVISHLVQNHVVGELSQALEIATIQNHLMEEHFVQETKVTTLKLAMDTSVQASDINHYIKLFNF